MWIVQYLVVRQGGIVGAVPLLKYLKNVDCLRQFQSMCLAVIRRKYLIVKGLYLIMYQQIISEIRGFAMVSGLQVL